MKFFKKIFFIFLSFFLISCTEAYREHFYGQRNIEKQEEIIFEEFASSWNIISFPRKGKEDFLLEAINNAKNTIFIEIYTFTKNEKIFQALLDAKNRWVRIKILLEWNVYGTPYINNVAYKFFQNHDFEVKYTDNNRYTFTHAKFWIIDETYFISTGNWTRSFFDKNREYIYYDNDEETREFLQNSEKELFVYVQSVTDANILRILEEKSENEEIFLCTADNEWNKKASEESDLEWNFAKTPYLHAKIMLSDEENIFLWSQNFTTNSLENNREMGILLKREDLYQKLKKEILEHCDA